MRQLSFLVLLLLFSCQGINKEKNKEELNLPSEEYSNATVNISAGIRKEATLKAKRLQNYREQKVTKGWDLNITFYDSTGKNTGYLVADSGFIMQGTNYTELFGSIIFTSFGNGTSTEPMTLWCSQLSWKPDSDIVRSDKPVRLKRKGTNSSTTEEINAQGFVSNLDFTRVSFIGEVKGKQDYEP